MTRTGTFKYVCEDCFSETRVSRKERDRAARPRCIECGSVRIVPKTAYAVKTERITARGAKEIKRRIKVKQGFISEHHQ